jgi:glycosyltransferase involved in cell wall biosynthesis
MDGFLAGVEPFIRQFPDHHPRGLVDEIRTRSCVLNPPFAPAPFDAAPITRGARCRIVWPHRWEHDKDPDTFFRVAAALASEGLDFEVAVAGQAFAETVEEFEQAGAALGGRLVHLGQPEGRAAYADLLASADVAVSTAKNEFFGLAMIEAAYSACLPLVPDRLAYPEIYPETMRYADTDDLTGRLRAAIAHRPAPGQGRALAERYTVRELMPAYRAAFERLFARGR